MGICRIRPPYNGIIAARKQTRLEPANPSIFTQEADTTSAVCCIRCDYDLRGVPADAACPECGLSLSRTLADRHRLEDCPPHWVRKLSIGVGILTLSAIWAGLVWLAYGEDPFVPIYGFRSNNDMSWVATTFPAVRQEHLAIAGLCVQFLGVWLVTSPEPGRPAPRRQRLLSWTWRIATVAAIAGYLIDTVVSQFFQPPVAVWFGMPKLPPRWFLITTPLVMTYALCPVIGFWRLRWLATRIGRPKLADYAGVVGVVLTGLVLYHLLVQVQFQYQDAFQRWVAGPFRVNWDKVRLTAAIWESVAPAVLLLAIAIVSWLARRDAAARWTALAAVVWLVATSFAAATYFGGYTRSLWKTVVVLAFPVVTTAVFYSWAVFLLTRMTTRFWSAATAADQAWRDADLSKP